MTTMMTSSPLDSDPVPSPVRGTTIVDVFKETARADAARTALRWREQEEWRSLSWGDYERSVTSVATALRDWGLAHGDRVGILADEPARVAHRRHRHDVRRVGFRPRLPHERGEPGRLRARRTAAHESASSRTSTS